MPEATLRDRAKRLLTASGRSDVPPFMVMDVMAAAARIEGAGGHVIHMEVGQPAAAAPKAAIAAARAALDRGRIDYTAALGIPSVWINRLGEDAHPPPTRERGDLNGLADVLDELVA